MGAALAAWNTFMAALGVVVWFLPWHVAVLRLLRLRWSDRFGRLFAVWGSAGVLYVPVAVVQHDMHLLVNNALIGGSAVYALWRAWREHRPPGRRLRDRAADAVRGLVERMQPARMPLPVRA